MSTLLRRRAKRERALREARFTVLGWWRSATFPIRHPGMWLYCRYIATFWELYYHGDQDKAIRFARLWPSKTHYIAEQLMARGDRRLGVPL